MSSSVVFSAGPSIEELNEGFPETYPRFSRILEGAGIPPRFFFRKDAPQLDDMLIGERAIVLDSLAYLESDELDLTEVLHREIAAGARVLCVGQPGNDSSRASLNTFLERYGMSHSGERHFRLDRYDGPARARSRADQLPVVPADIVAATDGLAAGVERVTLEQPSGVRSTSSEAAPLLWALANPDRVDYADTRTEPLEGDEAVAQMWTAPGADTPSLIVFGDGAWLMDELLGVADNERLASNLVAWLAGGLPGSVLAKAARDAIDRIELTLWDVISRRLRRNRGAAWLTEIAEALSSDPWLGDISDADEANLIDRLLLRHKIELARTSPDLGDVYLAGSPSRSKAKEEWGKAVDLRNRLAHAARRATSPVTATDVARVNCLDDELGQIWLRELAHEVADSAD